MFYGPGGFKTNGYHLSMIISISSHLATLALVAFVAFPSSAAQTLTFSDVYDCSNSTGINQTFSLQDDQLTKGGPGWNQCQNTTKLRSKDFFTRSIKFNDSTPVYPAINGCRIYLGDDSCNITFRADVVYSNECLDLPGDDNIRSSSMFCMQNIPFPAGRQRPPVK